jgi:hypothetical protein
MTKEEEVKAFYDSAARDLFPKMKSSVLAVMPIFDEEPDPRLCMQIGAAILFDKPILVVAPRNKPIPLALRTIANEIVEIESMNDPAAKDLIKAAILRMTEAGKFRGKAR